MSPVSGSGVLSATRFPPALRCGGAGGVFSAASRASAGKGVYISIGRYIALLLASGKQR